MSSSSHHHHPFSNTERLIGDAAKSQVAVNPHNIVFDAKRLIGFEFDEAEVQADMKHQVVSKGGKPYVKVKVECKGETKELVSASPDTCLWFTLVF